MTNFLHIFFRFPLGVTRLIQRPLGRLTAATVWGWMCPQSAGAVRVVLATRPSA